MDWTKPLVFRYCGSTLLFCICFISPYILIKNLASLEPRCSKSMNNMKTIKRFLALLLFFVAAMNVQTLSAQTNGDVNNDGTVNEADISAIIEIMKEANGVGPKKYYWYVGQENPANMTSISPIVTENGVTGWRETGSVLTATYEYNSTKYPISSNPSQNSMWYYALPENTGLGAFDAQSTNYAIDSKVKGNVTINGVKYNIYEGGASRKFNALTIKNK